MSWSISEILKPFKKLAVVYYQVQKLSADNKLIILLTDNTPARFLNITYLIAVWFC